MTDLTGYPRSDGRWGWRLDQVADLLMESEERLLFFAGSSEEQRDLPFDRRVLLTRDRGLLKRREVTHGLFVREDAPFDQIVAVVRRLEPRRPLLGQDVVKSGSWAADPDGVGDRED